MERNIDWLSFICTLTGDQTGNLGMCPDQELNWLPFALQEDAQSTEPQWRGQQILLNKF